MELPEDVIAVLQNARELNHEEIRQLSKNTHENYGKIKEKQAYGVKLRTAVKTGELNEEAIAVIKNEIARVLEGIAKKKNSIKNIHAYKQERLRRYTRIEYKQVLEEEILEFQRLLGIFESVLKNKT
ncbi:hypothetical protein HY989_05940 [Candidatus Micrarchaeota archaeon]|nr:hypothetical protein [Candidatus Micrarchaeota archaeon]